jgi:GT2 family glycosyltransferase
MEPYTEFRIDPCGFFFGVNMAIKRKVLFDVGGFNPESFGDEWLGDGETGLNRKLSNRGLPIGYVPNAVVYHHIPVERMTVAYFRRRMANQAACEAYSDYHNGIPRRSRLVRSIVGLTVRNVSCWMRAVLLRDRSDQQALAAQMQSALTQAQVKYLARLIYDKHLRALVLKKNWLDDAAVLAVAVLSERAGALLC